MEGNEGDVKAERKDMTMEGSKVWVCFRKRNRRKGGKYRCAWYCLENDKIINEGRDKRKKEHSLCFG